MSGRLSLAGRIAVVVDDHRVDERALPGGQARPALVLLVCLRERPVTREELAADVAWNADDLFVLTATGDGAHLWDVATQQRIQAFA